MLEIEHVSGGYRPGVTVVHGIDFAVDSGHAVGLIGRNGAGKTCLAQTLLGVLPAHGGSIRLDGTDLTRMRPRERIRHRLALVPEGRMVFPQLSVRENLEMAAFGAGLRLTVDRLRRVEDIFPLLARKAQSRAGTMSGGEQQWLALGRALVQEPKAIVLDEPSLGLSPVAIADLAESLLRIRQQGVALVLMEQNPHLLQRLCDTVLLLDQGQVSSSVDLSTEDGGRLVGAAYLGTAAD
ncbi:ABC transporter ATP-binding protein [Streptomyces sp. NPDC085927]|uniref:ABC transporter ATP-binding protein n=1 Tax=Streptomyces sp. NPDC085927 TaxID=3365738 RepID=UPI0037D38359